ncbi:hypothetical protein ZWY2020_009506 [Hordeum vulgare]|nr:hypothetical protein ZWY2020_009506 [Hordeum vulgare]
MHRPFFSLSFFSIVISLPTAFLRYLTGQTAYPGRDAPPPFLLPELTFGRTPFAPLHANLPDRDSSDLFSGCSDDEDDESPPRPAFPELETAIDVAIAEFEGCRAPQAQPSVAPASPRSPCCSAPPTASRTARVNDNNAI